jgi:hypothetical protein
MFSLRRKLFRVTKYSLGTTDAPEWEKRSQLSFLFWNFLLVNVPKKEVQKLRSYPQKCAGDRFCSATAAVLRWMFLKIKRVAGYTPPIPGGSRAVQLA